MAVHPCLLCCNMATEPYDAQARHPASCLSVLGSSGHLPPEPSWTSLPPASIAASADRAGMLRYQ
jgi:hypothetical protein